MYLKRTTIQEIMTEHTKIISSCYQSRKDSSGRDPKLKQQEGLFQVKLSMKRLCTKILKIPTRSHLFEKDMP